MDYTVHGVAKSQTQVSDFHFHFAVYSHFLFFNNSATWEAQKMHVKVSWKSLSYVWVFATPWTV